MTRYDFDDWLRYRLSDLPQEEVDRIAAFYQEAIEARMEDGMTEEEAIYDLGEPEALLEGIRADLDPVTYRPVRKHTAKTSNRAVVLFVALVMMIITLAIMIVGLNFAAMRPVRHMEIATEAVSLPAEAPVVDWSGAESEHTFDPGLLQKVHISADVGQVMVEPCDDNWVHVVGDDEFFDANIRGTTLYVENVSDDLLVRMPTAYYLRLSIDSELGNVELYEIIPATLNVSTDVGNIYLHNVAAYERINLSSDVGYIEGSLRYRQEDYCIDAEAEAGQCNLADSVNDGTPLTVSTDVGSIKIQFEN